MKANIHQHPSYSILALEGRLFSDVDLREAHDVMEKISNWKVVLDLSKLDYVNSSGIAFFVKILTRARLNQGDVVMLKVNEHLMKILELTKINQVFQLTNDLTEVDSYFKK